MITPTLSDVETPESLRSPLFDHEHSPVSTSSSRSSSDVPSWRRHRRTRSVSFPTPPVSPLNLVFADLAIHDVGVSPLTTTFALQESLLLPRTPISPTESPFGGLDVGFTFPPKPAIPEQQSLGSIQEIEEDRQESKAAIGDIVSDSKTESEDRKRKWSKRGSESCIASATTKGC